MNGKDNGGAEQQGSLGLFSVISIIVGIVIGASIFKVPGLILSDTSDPWTGLMLWAFGGFLALIGAFCYAELATTYPRSGGDYVYLTRAFGPWCGFLFGWAQLAVILPASIGAMAYVFGDFATVIYKLDDFTGLGVSSECSYAVLAVTVLSVLNIIGVTMGKLAQNVLFIAKILGLLAIIVAGFFWPQSSPADWPPVDGSTFRWGSLAIILVLYAYGGWNDAAFVAAEVRNPRRNIPLALFVGVAIITIVYCLVNAAYITGLGFAAVQASARPGASPVPAQLLENVVPNGAKAMSVIVMISALGAVNGLTFAGARVYATLGNDHPLFGWLGFWRPGHGAPILALIVQALITLTMIMAAGTSEGHRLVNTALSSSNTAINDLLARIGLADLGIGLAPAAEWQPGDAFELLFAQSAPAFWVFFLATGFSLFALRSRDPNLPRPFPVPLYPIIPFIFCNMCVYMLYESIMFVVVFKNQFLFALPLVLIGLPLYGLSRLIGYRGEPESEYPIILPK